MVPGCPELTVHVWTYVCNVCTCHTFIRTCTRVHVRARGTWCMGEGLILSSIIVAGQRHLCEEQTYLAQQAIHQSSRQAGSRRLGDAHDERDTKRIWRKVERGRVKTRPEVPASRARARVRTKRRKVSSKKKLLCRAGMYTFVLESVPGFSTRHEWPRHAEITPRNIRAVYLEGDGGGTSPPKRSR